MHGTRAVYACVRVALHVDKSHWPAWYTANIAHSFCRTYFVMKRISAHEMYFHGMVFRSSNDFFFESMESHVCKTLFVKYILGLIDFC